MSATRASQSPVPGGGYTVTVTDTATGQPAVYVTDYPGDIDFTITLTVSLHHRRHHHAGHPYTWQIGTTHAQAPGVTYAVSAVMGMPADMPQQWHDLRGRYPYKLRVTTPDGTVVDSQRTGTPRRAYAAMYQENPGGRWIVAAFGDTSRQAVTEAEKTVPPGGQCVALLAEIVTPGSHVLADAPYPDPLDRSGLVYPYLRAWCRNIGSKHDYGAHQLATAILDQAPPTAIYKDNAGVWHTAENISDRDTWQRIDALVRRSHGDGFGLGPFPWHEAVFTVTMRISAADWDTIEPGGQATFHNYITTMAGPISEGITQLLPRISGPGGTVTASLQA